MNFFQTHTHLIERDFLSVSKEPIGWQHQYISNTNTPEPGSTKFSHDFPGRKSSRMQNFKFPKYLTQAGANEPLNLERPT